MGDRASVSFRKDGYESVTLFSHWDGRDLFEMAEGYAKMLKEDCTTKCERVGTPLNRLEPGTVMVDFIRHLTHRLDRVVSNYYLGATPADGDNSDNGHHTVDL